MRHHTCTSRQHSRQNKELNRSAKDTLDQQPKDIIEHIKPKEGVSDVAQKMVHRNGQ